MRTSNITQEDKNLFMVSDDFEQNNLNIEKEIKDKNEKDNNNIIQSAERNKEKKRHRKHYSENIEKSPGVDFNIKIGENTNKKRNIFLEDKKYFQVNETFKIPKVKEQIKRSIDESELLEPKRSDTLKTYKISEDNKYIKNPKLSDAHKRKRNFISIAADQNEIHATSARNDNF